MSLEPSKETLGSVVNFPPLPDPKTTSPMILETVCPASHIVPQLILVQKPLVPIAALLLRSLSLSTSIQDPPSTADRQMQDALAGIARTNGRSSQPPSGFASGLVSPAGELNPGFARAPPPGLGVGVGQAPMLKPQVAPSMAWSLPSISCTHLAQAGWTGGEPYGLSRAQPRFASDDFLSKATLWDFGACIHPL